MGRARVAGWIAAAFAAAGCGGGGPPAVGPNVVLVTLESLRTDFVGAYGGRSPGRPEVPVTPNLDAFAAGASVFLDAHAVTSWTLASHASLFTGLYPSAHQTVGPRDRLDDSYPTLAEALRDRGFQTAGIVSGPYLRRPHNLQQGFEIWDDSIASLTSVLAHDDVTNPRMEQALKRFLDEQRDPARPFFLFAYFWDPHYDFQPPAPYDTLFVGERDEPFDARDFERNPKVHAGMPPERLAWLLAQYAGELRWTDEHLGRFFALLRERGLWEDTLVIVTADHGEEFFDHGAKGHKNNLYAESVRVPLIVRFPGQREGRREDRLVSLVDLLPTILEITDTPVDFPVEGRSLLEPAPPGRAILYELLSVWYYGEPEGGLRARRSRWFGVRQGDHKLLWSDGEPGAPRLFDVGRDPAEHHDLAAEQPARTQALRREFERGVGAARDVARRYRPGGTARLSREELEQLRALGYLP